MINIICRDQFRTLSNIYDGASSHKLFLQENLHHRCLIVSNLKPLSKIYQNKTKIFGRLRGSFLEKT